MCDYNEKKFCNDNSVGVTYSPNTEEISSKTKRQSIIVKFFLLFSGMAVVSAGSIGIYADLSDNSSYEYTNDDAYVSKQTDDVSNKQAINTDSGLIELASREDSISIPEIVKKVKPSVVGISSEFYGGTGTGTGIIMTSDGYIVTNAHVVQESSYGATVRASSVTVVLEDQSEYPAKIIGTDTRTDLAVIKIDSGNTPLTAAEFGNSDELLEGELAIAIGNPLGFELYGSTTCGIISALNRTITIDEYEMTLIQTDAAINPGNSGGPLLNSCGQVIGINSSKIISGYTEGLGFAIPINGAKPIIEDLINNGYVTGRPMLGISGENISYVTSKYYNIPEGIYVRFIDPSSSAAESGIDVGDIIVGINGTPITTMDELNEIKDKFSAGDSVTLSVYRENTEKTIEIKITLDEKTS
jgi:serine protease Do